MTESQGMDEAVLGWLEKRPGDHKAGDLVEAMIDKFPGTIATVRDRVLRSLARLRVAGCVSYRGVSDAPGSPGFWAFSRRR